MGRQAEQVHDLVDEEICYRESEIEELYLPDHSIITTWHPNFEEGTWFALFAANSENVNIKQVVILDLTDGIEIPKVKACLDKL